MNLELAVAESCGPTSCRVRSVTDGSTIEAVYGARVQDTIKVRPGDLVALDQATQPPEVVWRWWHGTVERIDGDCAEVSRNHNQPTPEHSRRRSDQLPVTPALAGRLRPGDTVFFGGASRSVLDVAREGVPTHPEWLTATFPAIVAQYQQSRLGSEG